MYVYTLNIVNNERRWVKIVENRGEFIVGGVAKKELWLSAPRVDVKDSTYIYVCVCLIIDFKY